MDVLQDTKVLSAFMNAKTNGMVLHVRKFVVIVKTRCHVTNCPAYALGHVDPDITGRCALKHVMSVSLETIVQQHVENVMACVII
ncbi:hypothetical protein DPMN_066458 [Dreissena polymorpha]|uniref:Uncharacterized protein n=1 Tax=Dreissena polymorpha TaxID=45954 RepID=A0A9D3YTJ0_DREPO|nr:hypothetical protein DPMN_066458 [Dreissena polymorpha]